MANSPKAHELRTLLTWQRPTPGDDFTRELDRWDSLGKVRAKLEAKAGREVVFADQVEAINSYTIWIRYNGEVRPEDRFLDVDGRVFNVVGVRNWEERNRWTVIEAQLSWRKSLVS